MKKVRCVFNNVNGQNTGVYCRTGPGKSYKSPGILIKKNCPNNGEFFVDGDVGGTNNYYQLIDPPTYKLPNQTMYVWLNKSFLQTIEWPNTTTNTTTTNKTETATPAPEATDQSTFKYSKGLEDQITALLSENKGLSTVANNLRVIGAPYQFTSVTDYRPFKGIDIGRKYLENILSEAPIVHFVPGVPTYLPDFSDANKEVIKNYVEAQQRNSDAISASILQSVNDMEGRYFDFVANYSEYMRYVNILCRICAQYMGIGDLEVPGTTEKYKFYDWSRYTNYKNNSSKTKSTSMWEKISSTVTNELFGDYRYLKCYVDPNSSFNEDMSNSTTQSQVAGIFDNVSGLAREINFLTSSKGTSKITDSVAAIVDTATGSFEDSTNNLARIIGAADHVISGSNIVFPELWSGSSYSKTYNFTINLVSPYGDVESIYLNVIMPMMHLIALGLPRQTSANSYTTPFLVKVFSKGWFSCEMGMVSSIQIEKGGDGERWNVNGLPTEAKVTLGVTDLYPNLFIPKASQPVHFLNNQGLIEFLAVTCGMDITKPNVVTKIQSIFSTYLNTMFDIPTNFYNNVLDGLRNTIEPLIKITR